MEVKEMRTYGDSVIGGNEGYGFGSCAEFGFIG